ncbi:hypothetical protein Dimus_006697 [Dionaea muscipula]
MGRKKGPAGTGLLARSSKMKKVAGLYATPASQMIDEETDPIPFNAEVADVVIDQIEQDDEGALDQIEDLPQAELSDEIQQVHASQVAHQLRLPPDDLIPDVQGRPEEVSAHTSICPLTHDVDQPSASEQPRADTALLSTEFPPIYLISSGPEMDDCRTTCSEHPHADAHRSAQTPASAATKSMPLNSNRPAHANENPNFKGQWRTNTSKTAWVPKVPVPNDGVADIQPTIDDGEHLDPTTTDSLHTVPVENPPANIELSRGIDSHQR